MKHPRIVSTLVIAGALILGAAVGRSSASGSSTSFQELNLQMAHTNQILVQQLQMSARTNQILSQMRPHHPTED